MDLAQTRAGSERSTEVLVIGQKSLLGDLRPVLRALAIGIALGLAGMTLVTMITR